MSDYSPDCWVILELSGSAVKDGPVRKVLGGWYGGYAGSDSWRMSSGIEKIVDMDTHWEIHNFSGSIYRCSKNCERFSMLMTSQYLMFKAQAETRPEGELTIRHVPIDEIPIG